MILNQHLLYYKRDIVQKPAGKQLTVVLLGQQTVRATIQIIIRVKMGCVVRLIVKVTPIDICLALLLEHSLVAALGGTLGVCRFAGPTQIVPQRVVRLHIVLVTPMKGLLFASCLA